MKAVHVVSKTQQQQFLNFPSQIFRKDVNFIRPLDKDIEEVFDEKRNKFFRFGECERFLFFE